ncbi:MAG: hypothetical protein FJ405_06965, partial [Verrucomicrobia bacterium]|nr:hypothetical protein [Verrucomicrobiota bacterium]
MCAWRPAARPIHTGPGDLRKAGKHARRPESGQIPPPNCGLRLEFKSDMRELSALMTPVVQSYRRTFSRLREGFRICNVSNPSPNPMPHSCRRLPLCWTPVLMLLLAFTSTMIPRQTQAQLSSADIFIIEAEDFNFNRGQTVQGVDVMPYLGGAYVNRSNAVSGVDYFRTPDPSSPLYRNDRNVPILPSSDMNREAWTSTNNWRLGAIRGNEWFNYTRQLPVGRYLVYAALSHQETAEGALRGSLSTISRVTNSTQTPVRLGSFHGTGTGSLQTNRLVVLRDTVNRVVILGLGGSNQNFRYTPTNGFVDYLKFVRARPPVIGIQPAETTAIENQNAQFAVALGSDDPASPEWQTNGVNVARGTNLTLSLPVVLGLDGIKVRCVLTNIIGTTLSSEVTLRVVPDQTAPLLARASNAGARRILLHFDEPVFPPEGVASQSFTVSGGISVLSVSQGQQLNVLELALGQSLVYDQAYTVTASNVRDRATTPNPILPGSSISFVTIQLAPIDIGNPASPGSLRRVPGGFDITGAGSDIGAGTDQFQFNWEPVTGNFDIRGRIASASVTDSFLHVGLMARETMATNASFAGSFASSAQLGCFFESRRGAGTVSAVSAPDNGFPVNYPHTWLRLRRAGLTLSGFASLDGESWMLLGTNQFTTLSNTVLVGLAISSQSSSNASHVQLRDYGPTPNPQVLSRLPATERLGPSSRRTGLVFSEIMYNPRPGSNLEFIEIYNAGAIFEELTGYELTGGIRYSFPKGLIIPAGAFLVIAADPAALQNAYGISGVLGPWTGSLNNAGDLVQLRDGRNALKLKVDYSSESPWPAAADGAGCSLILSSPSYGEEDPKAWSASRVIGGTPGQMDAALPSNLASLTINEVLANPATNQVEFLELYNSSSLTLNLAGFIITDDVSTNKFVVPAGTQVAGGQQISFDTTTLGFGLSSLGETVYLITPDGTRILDALRFGPQERAVSIGRFPNGSGSIRRLSIPTPGASNGQLRLEDVVLNEIMYNPISRDDGDEYVELHNRTAQSIDLAGWKVSGGIDFTFPAGASIPAGGYVVVSKNATQLRSKHGHLTPANTFGNFGGTLGNGGERIALGKPHPFVVGEGQNAQNISEIVITSELTYGTGGRWGKWSDGGGSSLELIDPRGDIQQPSNWADSNETEKAPWTTVDLTGPLDHGHPGVGPTRIGIFLQGPGECLVDNVEIIKITSTNLLINGNFELTNTTHRWQLTGTHLESVVLTNRGIDNSRCLHMKSMGDGDTAVNAVSKGLNSGFSGGNKGRIKGSVRWLAGWPEVLFRLQGGFLEAPLRLSVPENLGTPGQANSRASQNAGPAIHSVSHDPALPKAGQQVVVTCKVNDPDSPSTVTLRYRFDPVQTLTNVVMQDDGTGVDAIAGDGIFSAALPARPSGTIAFRIEAMDSSVSPASSVFPAQVPAKECLVRYGNTTPFGTFGHYHLWSTAATESARNSSIALNNYFRDATLVYGHGRIIYNAGFRDKGSPYHSGQGDFALTSGPDDLLLGVRDRVFGTTGNGSPESTGLRGRVSNWIGRELGLPYLHAHYINFYRNGALHQSSVAEDAEQPNNPYAEDWYPSGNQGELFKIAVWFEDNSTSGATGATMEQYRSPANGPYKLGRYRFNWQLRANHSANDFTNFFRLVDAVNAPGDHVPGLMAIADMEEWMRVFAYHRIVGNWDSWTFNVGQNMFLYRQPGAKWVLFPWDIDFVLGLGTGETDGLFGGQDPIMNTRAYDNFTFRRMMYRAFQDAIKGPMQPARYVPQLDARRIILAKNRITGLEGTAGVASYIEGRRENLRSQINSADYEGLAITNNNGANFVSPSGVVTLTGRAGFAIATIEVNGIPYPVRWTGYTSWSISIPLANGANALTLVGKDLRGNPVTSGTDTITVSFSGTPQDPKDFVLITEIQYNPLLPRSSFVELHNRSTTTPFDLSGWRLDGLGYVFPPGSILAPSNYMVLAKDRANFAIAYGQHVIVHDEFPGTLDEGGEHLRLIKIDGAGAEEVISDVRYDNLLPWPLQADGFGPSLQVVDVNRGSWHPGNWASTLTNDVNWVTPGRTNSVRQSLTAFPSVWINEVQPRNTSGQMDNAGEREPWIELFNTGTSP